MLDSYKTQKQMNQPVNVRAMSRGLAPICLSGNGPSIAAFFGASPPAASLRMDHASLVSGLGHARTRPSVLTPLDHCSAVYALEAATGGRGLLLGRGPPSGSLCSSAS